MSFKRRVWIFSTVWPEPQSSAAGVRLLQWVDFFLNSDFEVRLSSPSSFKAAHDWGHHPLSERVELFNIELNRTENEEQLKLYQPDIVLFDRFILEEQFGHVVYRACPAALVLLETQDLHFIRRARETVKERWLSDEFQKSLPRDFYHTETALRETASILRCDHAFVVSSYELNVLMNHFSLSPEQVSHVPFLYNEFFENGLSFAKRNGFSFIGNFRHAPNMDGLRWFRNQIWPIIKAKLPAAIVRVYGSYPSAEVMSFHQPAQGFHVLGSVNELSEVFDQTRVNLAPLRFGAGVKGKILESLRRGCPVVSTHVGWEGLSDEKSYDDAVTFAERCIELHENELDWNIAKEWGLHLMKNNHDRSKLENQILEKINEWLAQKKLGQLPRWWTRVARSDFNHGQRYFSKWIELKERK